MLKTNPTVYVYTDSHHSEKGFTFFSSLFALTILIITLPLVGYLLKSAIYSTSSDDLSVNKFFHFLRDELILSTDYSIADNKISLTSHENKGVVIKQYNDLVHRQVEGRGHEVYLRDIKTFKVIPLSYGFIAKVTTMEGNKYEKTIVYYD